MQAASSVLIVRLDSIGDALSCTPLVAALRARDCRVAIVLRPLNERVFARRAFERVHVAGFELRDSSRPNLKALARDAESIATARYDVALIATEDPGGYRLAEAAGIPVRIGFENGWGKPLKTLWVRHMCTRTIRRTAGLDRRAPHECEVIFALGRPLLGDQRASRDICALRPLVLDREPEPDSRILVQITNKWTRLGAPLDDVVRLVRTLGKCLALRLVAARDETVYAEQFGLASGFEVERMADVTIWKEAIGAARAVVTPDSGALHVAGMTGAPVVGAFAATSDYALQVARWSPWAAPHRIIAIESQWTEAAARALEDLLESSPARLHIA